MGSFTPKVQRIVVAAVAGVMKMTGAMETSFKLALKKLPSLRTAEVNKTNVSLMVSMVLLSVSLKASAPGGEKKFI